MNMATRNLGVSQALVIGSIFLILILSQSSCATHHHHEPRLEHCGFDAIYNFGTSLSDTGNSIKLAPQAGHGKLPYGKTIHKATGRSSDGYLMIDFIAKSARLPFIDPYLDRNATHSSGVNFAVAGAPTLSVEVLEEMNIKSPWVNSSFNVQLDWLEEYLKRHCHDTTDCQKKLKPSLFITDFGPNDYGYAFSQNHTIEDVKKMDLVTKVVEAITTSVEEFIHRGARNILVMGTFPMGCLPKVLTRQSSNETAIYDEFHCAKDYNDFISYHNDRLNESLGRIRNKYPDAHIVYGDLYQAMQWILKNKDGLGYKSTTKACCGPINEYNVIDGDDFMKMCGAPGIPVCSKPEEYIYWDGNHWTQKTHEHMATRLIKDFLPKFQCNA